MRFFLLIFVLFNIACNAQDVTTMKELAQELGCTGTIGFYRTDVEFSEIHSYKKYLELRLDCPNLFEKYDTLSLRNVAAYRLYIKLKNNEKKEFEAIRVVFKNDITSALDTSNFFSMSFLESIYAAELVVREYFKALKNNDLKYLKNAFDSEKFGYTSQKIDSINNSFLTVTKGKLDESRLYNWSIIEDENKKYKLLVFLTDSENNYNTKFQFAVHDSLKNKKNIVSMKF